MTELMSALEGRVTPAVQQVAMAEDVDPETLALSVARGESVIIGNKMREHLPRLGVGRILRVKVNANIGTSADRADIDFELEKLRAAENAGADTVMDLSTGGDLTTIRRRILASTSLPVGSVPIYSAAVKSAHEKGAVLELSPEDMLDAIKEHICDGIDFVTVHAGVTRSAVAALERTGRICDIVSRGGTILAEWMLYHDAENPIYERFDEILQTAYEYDAVISLGDGMRPGALADAGDAAQIEELITLGRLAERCREAGVQVIIEGPGHVPIDEIASQVQLQKTLCKGAPFYVLGPLVTDVAAGYDHITSAIGGAIAAMHGADFLCYVTPSEHLSLPTVKEVREGVIASRIAAHAADIARRRDKFIEWDNRVAKLRAAQDWDGQINELMDPEHARAVRDLVPAQDSSVCSMCGELCVFKQRARSNRGK